MNPLFTPHSTQYNPNSTLNCVENNKKFELETNSASFVRVKIDGGVEQNTSNKKCDYLIIKEIAEDIEIFVELKGKQIQDAYEQIIESYANYANQNINVKHYAIIVTSHISPNERTTLQNIKTRLSNQNITLLSKNKIVKTKYNPTNNTIEKTN